MRPRALGTTILGVVLAISLTACSSLFEERPEVETASTAVPEAIPSPTAIPFNSEFSRDGTFQSHSIVEDVDFVFTIWSAKTTPRMQQWHPKGDKFFSFTFQGYDTQRRLRDRFGTKRKVWMERIQIESRTTTTSGQVESPYNLNEFAPDVTFDPQARKRGQLGMLITSPKGAFELRNQAIKSMADDTEGITLTFRATVHIQSEAGSQQYTEHEIVQQLPIAIFESEEPTKPQPVPYNST